MKTIKINDKEGSTHLINTNHIVRIEAYGGSGVMVLTSDGLGIKTDLNLSEVESMLKV